MTITVRNSKALAPPPSVSDGLAAFLLPAAGHPNGRPSTSTRDGRYFFAAIPAEGWKHEVSCFLQLQEADISDHQFAPICGRDARR